MECVKKIGILGVKIVCFHNFFVFFLIFVFLPCFFFYFTMIFCSFFMIYFYNYLVYNPLRPRQGGHLVAYDSPNFITFYVTNVGNTDYNVAFRLREECCRCAFGMRVALLRFAGPGLVAIFFR